MIRSYGFDNVALYSGSLKEWADDAELPMVTLDEVEDWSS
jgi:3-mercaptopyruvate sulfurtransferase SseA